MSGRGGWDELKDTEQAPQGRRGHQAPDPSLHDPSFGNRCSLELPSAPLWWCLLSFPFSTPGTLCSFYPLFWFFQGSCWFLSLRNNTLPLFTIPWNFFLLKPCSLPFHFTETQLQVHIFNADFSHSLLHIILRWEQLGFSSAPKKGNLWTFLWRANGQGISQSAA